MRSFLAMLFLLSLPGVVSAVKNRPHLFFIEGSIGGTTAAALSHESDAINEHGTFYWSYSGNLYRDRPSPLTLTAGIGYEFLAFDWLGLRALYSYSSHLHMMTASTGSGRNRRSSSVGGQVAETGGYFLGPVLRYPLFGTSGLSLEFPLQWGIHSGAYTPLASYSEMRALKGNIPYRAEEFTTQDFRIHKLRYGIGAAFLSERSSFYASLSFCVEQGITKTAVGPQPTMVAGSAWNSYLLIVALGWRV